MGEYAVYTLGVYKRHEESIRRARNWITHEMLTKAGPVGRFHARRAAEK